MKEEGGLIFTRSSLGLTGSCSRILQVGNAIVFVFLVSYRQQCNDNKLVKLICTLQWFMTVPGGSSSRVPSRIQDLNNSPGRACSRRVDDEERAQSELSSSRQRKSSSSPRFKSKVSRKEEA